MSVTNSNIKLHALQKRANLVVPIWYIKVGTYLFQQKKLRESS